MKWILLNNSQHEVELKTAFIIYEPTIIIGRVLSNYSVSFKLSKLPAGIVYLWPHTDARNYC